MRQEFGMRRSARLMIVAAGLGALTSCSTASRMSVVDPGSIVRLPPTRPNDAHAPRFVRPESLAASGHGFVLISADTFMVLDAINGDRGLSRVGRPVYRADHIAHRLDVYGYGTADHRWHNWPGWVRVAGDSLEFVSVRGRLSGLQRGPSADTLRLPRETIESLAVSRVDAAHTVAATVVGVAMVSAVMVVGAIWGLSSVQW